MTFVWLFVACIVIIVIIAVHISPTIKESKTYTGVVTAKWTAEIKDGFGSSTGHFFEINNSYYIGVTPLEYNNYNVNDTFQFHDRHFNPQYDRAWMP